MRVTAKIDGDLRAITREIYGELEVAVTRAVTRAGLGLQAELRGQVTRAGLGRRLANTWRSKAYPEAAASASAAAVVSSKAPMIVRAFGEGATIRSKSGFFLAVPSEAAPKRGVGGRRINPSNFPEFRYGPLRFVYRRAGPSMLVVDGVRIGRTGRVGKQGKAGGLTKTGRYRKGVTTVPMFFLFPQVRLRKRLDVDGAASRWVNLLPPMIGEEARRVARQR